MDESTKKTVEQVELVRKMLLQEKLSNSEKLDIKEKIHSKINSNRSKPRVQHGWRTAGSVAAALVICVGLGYEVHNESIRQETAQHEKTHQLKVQTLSEQDMGIGKLKLGMSLDDVKQIYGTPTSTTSVQGNGNYLPGLNYPKQGFSVAGPTVWQITVSEGFTGSTTRGIHIGSTKQQVEKVYPGLIPLQNDSWFIETSNREYGMEFTFKNNLLTKLKFVNFSNGIYWQEYDNPSLITSMVASVNNQTIEVSPSPTWNTTSLTITPQTLIWDNGKLVSYNSTSGLKENDLYSAVVYQMGNQTIAKEVYPQTEIHAVITGISNNRIQAEVVQQVGGTWKPTGQTVTLLYDLRTEFYSHTSSLLQKGVMVDALTLGVYPAQELLLQGVTGYTATKTSNGTYIQGNVLS